MDKTPGENSTASARHYKGEGRVSFLANLESIRNEVEAGWPLQAVYDRHKDRLNIQYMQFHRYVQKFIKGESPKKPVKSGMDSSSMEVPVYKQASSTPSHKKHLNDATPLSDSELF
ncbi:TraK family protein [Vampirovibrio sp.]|uniref:TraK family protein n=1 Tax=Vampirovibrio sp. TaxID=2717857 RepID=UPI0035940E80